MSSEQGSKEFKTSLLGCFSDPKLCIFTFIVPCYVIGKNAEGIGEDCILVGLLSCVGLNFNPLIRWRLRQERNLKGSMLMDVLVHTVLPCCAMIQDAKEINWDLPKEVDQVAEAVQHPGGQTSMARS